MNNCEIYKEAIGWFGEQNQIDKTLEEMGELIQALIKFRQHRHNEVNVAEEIADVGIMLEQLQIIFKNGEQVRDWKETKVKRLDSKVKNYQKGYKKLMQEVLE